MDSRLLNVLYEDHFDNNYAKFESDPNFWSSENETLGLQLSETLQGILPMSPTDDSKLFFDTNIEKNCYSIPVDNSFHKHIQFLDCDSNGLPQSKPSISLLSVDSNDDSDSNLQTGSENESYDEEDFRSLSRGTFRSRTESSSIGDYESHSSDYDESDSEHEEKDTKCAIEANKLKSISLNDSIPNNDPNLSLARESVSKSECVDIIPTLDNIGEMFEVDDNFELGIDATTFDLAAFITQDDDVISKQRVHKEIQQIPVKSIKIESSDSEMSSDSDLIVDVETVECENSVIPTFIDNVKEDPSWSPENYGNSKCKKKSDQENNEEKSTKPPRTKSIFSVVPSKRQCNILKRKGGNAGKIIPVNKTSKVHKKSLENINSNSLSKQQVTPVKVKNQKNSICEKTVACSETVLEKPNQADTLVNNSINTSNNINGQAVKSNTPVVKRKLNLEEYKKRRETFQHVNGVDNKPSIMNSDLTNNSKAAVLISGVKQESASLNDKLLKPIVNNLQFDIENFNNSHPTDPITKAKNKVLRLQELKKAQQIKIIDYTVSSKVGRVTKLLPLKEIVKDRYSTNTNNVQPSVVNNSQYEEITIVSTSSNTEITIPPIAKSSKSFMPSSRSLLKSSELLYDTFQKVKSSENVKLSSHSLIASIQEVVVKKSLSNVANRSQTVDASSTQSTANRTTEGHGENKIIMHLRKDRIKTMQNSFSTQTELLPEFPTLNFLSKLPTKEKNKKASRRFRARNDSSNRSNSSSDSDSSNFESDYNKRRCERKKRKSSYSSSCSRSRHSSSISRSRSRSRSRSNSRNRSQTPSPSRSNSIRQSSSSLASHKKRRPDANISQPAVEERRIVYVGRIEDETSREDLRQKFLAYGPIKQITIHYKDTGMKYGFITYNRAADAFQVIDNGTRDETINMYDISFGGRRAFCRASYADLDNAVVNNYPTYSYTPVASAPKEVDSFEALLQKVKAKMSSSKGTQQQPKA